MKEQESFEEKGMFGIELFLRELKGQDKYQPAMIFRGVSPIDETRVSNIPVQDIDEKGYEIGCLGFRFNQVRVGGLVKWKEIGFLRNEEDGEYFIIKQENGDKFKPIYCPINGRISLKDLIMGEINNSPDFCAPDPLFK